MLAFVWLAGALALMVLWLTACWRARRALRYAVLCPLPEAEAAARRLGLRRPVQVFCSERLASPILLGFFRPRILLPAAGLPAGRRLECILAHEMVHLRRRDQFTKTAAFFITALHWYNPLVWLSFRLFDQDIESSCDQAVLDAFGEETRQSYAAALVDCAGRGLRLGAGFLAFARSRVAARVHGILRYRPLPRWQLALFAGCTVAIGLGVSANPVLAEYAVYTPASVAVSGQVKAEAARFTDGLLETLAAGDGARWPPSAAPTGPISPPSTPAWPPWSSRRKRSFTPARTAPCST